MIDYLIDTNLFVAIFKGNAELKKMVESVNSSLDATVYIECLQGSKANREKEIVRNYLSHFAIFYHTPDISKRTVALIDEYSNSRGLMLPDALIAATCLEYELTLITYNIADFEFIKNLKCLKPDV
jgi:predicted nucleic acid-binding protein